MDEMRWVCEGVAGETEREDGGLGRAGRSMWRGIAAQQKELLLYCARCEAIAGRDRLCGTRENCYATICITTELVKKFAA